MDFVVHQLLMCILMAISNKSSQVTGKKCFFRPMRFFLVVVHAKWFLYNPHTEEVSIYYPNREFVFLLINFEYYICHSLPEQECFLKVLGMAVSFYTSLVPNILLDGAVYIHAFGDF